MISTLISMHAVMGLDPGLYAVQVTDSMEGIEDNTALLCITDIARAQ